MDKSPFTSKDTLIGVAAELHTFEMLIPDKPEPLLSLAVDWMIVCLATIIILHRWRVCLTLDTSCTSPFRSGCSSHIQQQSEKRRQDKSISVRQYFLCNKNSFVFPCWALWGPSDYWVLYQRAEHVRLLIGKLFVSSGTLYQCFIRGGYLGKVTPFFFFFLPSVTSPEY